MSRENVEVVRRGYELVAAGDLETLLAYLDQVTRDDVELRTVGGLPDVHELRGKHAVKAWYVELLSSDAFVFEAEPEEFIDTGEAVVVPARHTAVGRGSGARLTNRLAMVFGFSGGKIAYFDVFRTKERALEAASRDRPA